MSGTLVSFEIGYLVGLVLFFICERKGLIHRWSSKAGVSRTWIEGRAHFVTQKAC